MDSLAKKLDVVHATDWRNVTGVMVKQNEGESLLKKYHGSLSKLLASVYPEYKQLCRNFVLRLVADMKLSTIEAVLTVPSLYLVETFRMTFKIHSQPRSCLVQTAWQLHPKQ